MGFVAAISSAKGGSGKTTTALNLAAALHSLGRDVTIVDCNLNAPSLAVLLGAPGVPVALHHVLKGEAALDSAVYAHHSGLKIVPGSLQNHDLRDEHHASLGSNLRKISSSLVLVDSAPGFGKDAEEVLKHAHEIVLVTTPDIASVTQTLKTAKRAERYGKQVTGVVVTRYGHDYDLALTEIEHVLGHRVIGVIPEDPSVGRAARQHEAVVFAAPSSPAAQAYTQLAMYLTGDRETPATDNVERPSEEQRPGFGGEQQSRAARFLNWFFGR